MNSNDNSNQGKANGTNQAFTNIPGYSDNKADHPYELKKIVVFQIRRLGLRFILRLTGCVEIIRPPIVKYI